jgi:hypothetical protein
MKKAILLAVIAAVTMSMSAQADTRHKQRVASNAKQCLVVTDTLGHGFWQGCGTVNTRARAEISIETTPQTVSAFDGGGGGGGGGGR